MITLSNEQEDDEEFEVSKIAVTKSVLICDLFFSSFRGRDLIQSPEE